MLLKILSVQLELSASVITIINYYIIYIIFMLKKYFVLYTKKFSKLPTHFKIYFVYSNKFTFNSYLNCYNLKSVSSTKALLQCNFDFWKISLSIVLENLLISSPELCKYFCCTRISLLYYSTTVGQPLFSWLVACNGLWLKPNTG